MLTVPTLRSNVYGAYITGGHHDFLPCIACSYRSGLACGAAGCGFAAAGAGLHAAGPGAGADVLRSGSPAGTGALPADDRELAAPRGTGGGADRPVRDCRCLGLLIPRLRRAAG